MAKKKNKSRKQGLLSKVVNTALVFFAFSRPLVLLFRNLGNLNEASKQIAFEATGGLVEGRLDTSALARFYAPMGAAAVLGKVKQFVMRMFPVRG